jgi:hypothetical protein
MLQLLLLLSPQETLHCSTMYALTSCHLQAAEFTWSLTMICINTPPN